MIKATIIWPDGRRETKIFEDLIELSAWAEEHHGEYNGIQYSSTDQGRDAE